MTEQEEMRKRVKMAKAMNNDIYYKDFAEYLCVSQNSFYNWLKGYYNLSNRKLNKLNEIVIDLIQD